ncbi:MAG TPA: radical SAM protein [Roseiflexaceae bacterium]|nr:radical SAM protein [Roseiflexaceae bacterium]
MERLPLPTYVQIEPVGQCNLRCQMCPIQFREEPPAAFMPFPTYTRLVDSFPDLTELHLQGLGEPLMHPRFFDMVTYAAEKGIRVSTNTNGTLFSERRAEQAVTCGLASIHISIDGAQAATYERIRVRAQFATVIRGVERLVAARARHGGVAPHLRLTMVLMRQNIDELIDLIELTARLGIAELFVQHLCHDFGEDTLPAHYASMRQFVDEQTVTTFAADTVEQVFAAARERAAQLGVKLRLPRPIPRPHRDDLPGRERCSWPWTGAYIAYDGRAMPCCMVATPDRASFGNMAQDGVIDVWENDAYSDFRLRLESKTPPAICQSCAVYQGTF